MTSQPHQNIKQAIVAILTLSGKRTQGTGFVLGKEGLIATCAHVVEGVLGTTPADGTELKVRFTATGRLATAIVKLEWYRAVDAEDIALLVLTGPLPPEISVLPTAPAAGSVGHRIRSFGYPDYDTYDGLGAVGLVVEQVTQNGVPRLQLESTQITHGYSGGPIWDVEVGAVVGQVVSGLKPDAMDRHAQTAFATPIELLLGLVGRAARVRQPFEPETVPVPAGYFSMGSLPGEGAEHERDQHKLYLPDFSISRTPITNESYAHFLGEARHSPPPGWLGNKPPAGKERHPVVNVSWFDAVAYCTWLSGKTDWGYRLPTEAEWEKAARGDDGRLYPWGNTWDENRCNCGRQSKGTKPVDNYPDAASPYGCLDMVGNVREWTSTLWGEDLAQSTFPYPYDPSDGREDQEDRKGHRVIRGSSYGDRVERHRCAARSWYAPDNKNRKRGFRVVLDLPG